MRKILTATVVAVMMLLLAVEGKAQEKAVYQDVSQDVEMRVEDALSRMTLAEKVALCHCHGKFYSPGVARLGIPGLWHSDGPHGVRAEMDWNEWKQAGWDIDSCTAFPSLTCLAATWNPELARQYGKAIGEEAAYRRKNVLLGPGVNICRTPLNGRNFEYLGEDPLLASRMCVPYIQGVQSNGVACCVKHFALNNQEWGRWSISVEVGERALREIYLPAFHAAVKEGGVWSLMGSYNKLRGTHCSHNNYLLNKILKNEWGFDGVVMSDWDATHDQREAVMNGLDLEMGTSSRPDKGMDWRHFRFDECYLGNDFLKGLQQGKYEEATVNEKARRVLRLIFRTAYNADRQTGNMDYDAHGEVCRTIGGEGVVLLKNDAVKKQGKLLPLNKDFTGKILVVGDNAVRELTKNGGSSELKARHEESVLSAMQDQFGNQVAYARGYAVERPDNKDHAGWATVNDSLRKEAVAMAKDADLVVFVGGLNKDRYQDCEDSDRKQYALPYDQGALIEALATANPKVVCVLMSGCAVEMNWADRVPAILQAWYLGSEAGHTMVDLLTGRVNPSGKLPISIPFKLEDCAAHSFGQEAYPGDGKKVVYKEGVLVGYRWYDTRNIKPRYPFGFGLSYTSFRLGKASVTREGNLVKVYVPVKNTGKLTGKEVVQVYVGEEHPTVERPTKELKAFCKVELQPGEEQMVELTLDADCNFAFYDETAKAWRTNPGDYLIYVGTDSSTAKPLKIVL